MVLASRSKRCLRTGSLERCAGRILTETVRAHRLSLARYTSPIPPAPSGPTISYGPSFVPEMRGIIGRDYTAANPCRRNSGRVREPITSNQEVEPRGSQVAGARLPGNLILTESESGNVVTGALTPVLAKQSRSFY